MFGRKKKAEVISELTSMLDKLMEEKKELLTPKALVVTDLSKGFNPIEGLKPGDKLRIKDDQYNNYNIINKDTILTVHRVGNYSSTRHGSSSDNEDFTVLFLRNGTIMEYSFDSRRFERVE